MIDKDNLDGHYGRVNLLACRCGAPFLWAGRTAHDYPVTECLNHRSAYHAALGGFATKHPTLTQIIQFDGALVVALPTTRFS